MTWTLLIIMVLNGSLAISTDMKFVDELSCKDAGDRVFTVVEKTGAKPFQVACIKTPGRE